MNLSREFIRITAEDPIVLSVSPLSDFLWEDFVRDTRPIVKYLSDKVNIGQLSRLGKELYDFLYNGEIVTPLIELDDIETYFRAKQNGESCPYPKNYKPENYFWVRLFTEIRDSASWPQLAAISTGDQFNSGNNAINILNELSEAIQDKLEELQALTESDAVKELKDTREAFSKAQAAFMQSKSDKDLRQADNLRSKGKALSKQVEDAMQQLFDDIKPEVNKSVDKAKRASDDMQKALQHLAGDQKGKGTHLKDIDQKRKLANKLSNNLGMKKLIKRLGALKQTWYERKLAKAAKANYSDIVGAKFSDEVIKSFPAEIALAATETGKALFAIKYAQKTLLTKDYEAKVKQLDKGPVVMYIDISGSMMGDSETWSKAIAYVVAEECLNQKREIQIHLFDTQIQKSIVLDKNRKDNSKLLDFVLGWVTKGGTNFSPVINHALTQSNVKGKADILLITDGQASASRPYIKRLTEFKKEHGVQWTSYSIGPVCPILKEFSDYVYSVDITDDPKNCELFQNAM